MITKAENGQFVSEPETFVSDYINIAENISEFHIIALEDGNGEMVFQCVKDDGSADMYTLGLSISRHQENQSSKLIQLRSKFPGV